MRDRKLWEIGVCWKSHGTKSRIGLVGPSSATSLFCGMTLERNKILLLSNFGSFFIFDGLFSSFLLIVKKGRKGCHSWISFTCCRWNTRLESKYLGWLLSLCLQLTALHLQTRLLFPHENLNQGNVAEADNFSIFLHSDPDKDEQT